jgi:hypothetical protein
MLQMVVRANNSLSVTDLSFNVTIIDVNQPPVFQQQTYTANINEDVAVQTSFAVAYVGTKYAH